MRLDLPDVVDHFRGRVLQDAIASVHADQLDRRADQFLAARPQPDDFHGHATPERLSTRWQSCTAIAEALGHKADLIRDSRHDDPAPEVWAALKEVGAA